MIKKLHYEKILIFMKTPKL